MSKKQDDPDLGSDGAADRGPGAAETATVRGAADLRTSTDSELEDYRSIVEEPKSFEDGFNWTVVFGALFCGVLMFPGAIYLGLLSGLSMNMAAQWVTVIVFSEIVRRSLNSMTKQQMVVLLMVAGTMIGGNALMPGGPFGTLIWKQYLVGSDAVRDVGLYGRFPSWWAPPTDSPALAQRTFWHSDWIMPIVFMVFMLVTSFVDRFTLGYAMFRLTSDVEKLPFPMAPVGAQGATALAEEQGDKKEKSWRWTAFSIGTVLGLAFGFLQVGVPAFSSAFLSKPITPIPLPWLELTPVTEGILPATPTGLTIDLGLVMLGLVLPFWAVVGSVLSALVTFTLNPVLYHAGVLTRWQPGMDTVSTTIANQVDFYFSFNIGMAIGLAVVSIFQTVKQVRRTLRESRLRNAERPADAPKRSIWHTPAGRGDWSMKLCFLAYFGSVLAMIIVCKMLVPDFSVFFLAAFGLLYTPLVSYLNARISGIAGQTVEIPFVREAFILLSGVRGVTPWLVPLPIENHGNVAQEMRTFELTGTKLTSMVKAWLLTSPLVLILGFVFWGFLWADGPIPSDMFPFAQQMWDLHAQNTMILWSSTTGEPGVETLFDQSWHPGFAGAGISTTVVLFTILSAFGAPTMLVYGLVRGFGMLPHSLIFEFLGAAVARFYLHRRFGKKPFLQIAPILFAGYLSGVGLIGMAAVAVRLIKAGISQSPI